MERERNHWESRKHTPLKELIKVCSLALLISLSTSCEDKKISHLPEEWTLSNLIELPINTTDTEEIQNYEIFLDARKLAENQLSTLSKNEKLKEFTGNFISLDKMLAVYIKESRLKKSAKSKSWAQGFWQLKPEAIAEVSKRLQESWVSTKYDPASNPSDNLIYSILYMSHIQQQVKKYINKENIQVNDEDLLLFSLSAYNMWINKWKTLYSASGTVNSWDDFVKYIVKDLMKLNGKWKEEKDSSYGVLYRNYFENKDYSWDSDIIFKHQGQYLHTLTKSKAQEIVRYGEVIKGIQGHLSKEQEDFDHIKISENKLYSSVQDWINEQEKNSILKEWFNKNALITKILLDNGYTMKWVGRDTVYGVTVNKAIIDPYLVDKNFGKYKFHAESYDTVKQKYLWSIINDLIKDNEFIKSLHELNINPDKDDINEMRSVIRQYTMEAIIRFNQERRKNWSETGSDDVRIPEKKYFQKYWDLRTIETPLFSSQEKEQSNKVSNAETSKSGSLYADASLDILGNSIKKWPTEFSVTSLVNSTLIEADKKNGKRVPTGIIIHGTEWNVDNSLSLVKAHFYIDWEGKIYQYTTSKTNGKENINYPKTIVALNHAGIGGERYGFSWENNRNATYNFIGIEVASRETSIPNEKQNKALETLLSWLSTTYKIPQKNILTHQQVATSRRYGRGRKSDLFGLDFKKIGMVNNYDRLDQDIISGRVSPNMQAQVGELKQRGMKTAEIEKVLSGVNMSILLCRQNKKAWENRMNKQDINAWATLAELKKKGYF